MAAINHKIRKPTPTEIAIAEAILLDGGAKMRGLQEKWFPKIKDAYRTDVETGRRAHYGFSGAGPGLGELCERALWLRWRWMSRAEFVNLPENATQDQRVAAAQMHRLLNRGHLEEARFLSMLEMIGVEIEDPTDGQERVSAVYGHAGSALDAVLFNTPCAPNERILGEFKTSNADGFKSVLAKGCFESKLGHYVQMQLCMATKGIHKCLYMMVNKNNDALYTELIHYDEKFAKAELDRIERIIYSDKPGPKISSDPSWFACKLCDCYETCQTKQYTAERSCRSCIAGVPDTTSNAWRCKASEGSPLIPKDFIAVGCSRHKAFTL